MEIQCRICLDSNNPETMRTPCLCRGTSAHIHESCLQRYFEYFPDRRCRVCQVVMAEPPSSMMIDIVLLGMLMVWLVGLLLLTPITDPLKVMYFVMLCSVLGFSYLQESIRGWMCLGLLFLSAVLTFLTPTIAVQFIAVIGVIWTIGLLLIYVPPDIMLLIMCILLSVAYSVLTLMFFALKQDPLMTAFFMPVMVVMWICVLHARPPVRM